MLKHENKIKLHHHKKRELEPFRLKIFTQNAEFSLMPLLDSNLLSGHDT